MSETASAVLTTKLKIMQQATTNPIEFTRVNNDTNGNPCYVCHFLELITDEDRKEAESNKYDIFSISTLYNIAVKKANKIGGRKYHNKKYGGGIVFQSYNIAQTERDIKAII